MNKTNSRKRLIERILKRLKTGWTISQLFARSTKTPDTHGENPEAKTSEGSRLLVTIRLGEFPLSDFIKCWCYGDLSPVQGNDHTWKRLLSEYYVAKQDAYASRYLELILTMERIRHRAAWIDFMATTITTLYTDGVANILRQEYPRFKFTYESYKSDLKAIANIEKVGKMQFDTAKKEFEQMEKKSGGATQTPQEKEHAIFKSVIGINAALQSSYNVQELSALTYALLLHEVDTIIEKQKKNG